MVASAVDATVALPSGASPSMRACRTSLELHQFSNAPGCPGPWAAPGARGVSGGGAAATLACPPPAGIGSGPPSQACWCGQR
eukprot:5363280-Alexandrium_andersonii.AAC.1